MTHEFLLSLERSGSATGQTGWLARHLLLRNANKAVCAVMPCYLKSHSRGEFVFDHAWAEAFARAGGRYYPKLISAVPFTPVTGPRVMCARGTDKKTALAAFDQAIRALCNRHEVSSAHITFLPETELEHWQDRGWMARNDTQFHWKNRGYRNFDEFLQQLSSRKRKNIKKERASIARLGLNFELLQGNDLNEKHFDVFYEFYLDTGGRKWGTPYLTRDFFSLASETMANDILLVMVRDGGEYIAGALNFIGSQALYGRYWGAKRNIAFLHFETCYYQAIEYAIHNQLACVEAGAQGPHKLARGYEPVMTYSAHHIVDPGFASAVSTFLDEERSWVERDNQILSGHTPYRKS